MALMELENIRIVKEMRNSVNRQVNCETANINKTVSAAVKQMEDIRYIQDTIGLESLPENLQEMARGGWNGRRRHLRSWGSSGAAGGKVRSQSPAEKTQPYGGGFKGKVPGAVRKRSIRRYEEDNHEEKNNYR